MIDEEGLVDGKLVRCLDIGFEKKEGEVESWVKSVRLARETSGYML